VTIVNTAT